MDRLEIIYHPFNFGRIEKLSMDETLFNDKEKGFLKEDYIIAVSRMDNVQRAIKI